MTSFSIDDVRDIFMADMRQLLKDAEDRVRELAGTAELSAHFRDTAIPGCFELLAQYGHSMEGTCALVGVESVRQVARQLQRLAEEGREAINQASVQSKRANRIAELCRLGTTELRAMVDLELAGDRRGANAKADAFLERLEEAPPAPLPGELPPGHERPSFAQAAFVAGQSFAAAGPQSFAAGPPSRAFGPASFAGPASFVGGTSFAHSTAQEFQAPTIIDQELKAVFDTELEEAVSKMLKQLEQLEGDPTHVSTVVALERTLHGLAGAAGAVGYSAASEECRRICGVLTGGLAAGETLEREHVGALANAIDQIVRLAGHPGIRPGQAPATTTPSEAAPQPLFLDDELREAFGTEIVEAERNVSGLYELIQADPSDLGALEEARKVHHRLKGACAAVGLVEGEAATRGLQEFLEGKINSGEGMTEAELRQLFADTNHAFEAIHRALVTRHSSAAESAAREVHPEPHDAAAGLTLGGTPLPELDHEIRATFENEARSLLVAILGHLEHLGRERGPQSATLDKLASVCHTLKGAAGAVGEMAASREASRLESRVREKLAHEEHPSAAWVDVLRVDVLKIFDTLGFPAPAASPARTEETAESITARAKSSLVLELAEAEERAVQLADTLVEGNGDQQILARGELSKIFHRLRGSALLLGEEQLARGVEDLQQQTEDLQVSAAALAAAVKEWSRTLGRLSAEEPQSLPDEDVLSIEEVHEGPATTLALERQAVQLPTDNEILQTFTLESRELLDQLEKSVLTLETSTEPKGILELCLRNYHTLKGVILTMGLGPTGRALHIIEDFMEQLLAGRELPNRRDLVSLLLGVNEDLRRNLQEAQHGYVETSIATLERAVSRLMGPGPRRDVYGRDSTASGAHSVSGAESMGHSEAPLSSEGLAASGRESNAHSNGSQAHSNGSHARSNGTSSAVSAVSNASGARSSSVPTSSAAASSAASSAARNSAELAAKRRAAADTTSSQNTRVVRVDTARLDRMMNLAGELVVSRSRLTTRVQQLKNLQAEVSRSRRKLLGAVEDFREEYDFTWLGKGDGARPEGVAPSPASPTAGKGDVSLSKPFSQFSELELDHYDNINIFSRRLAEMTGDVSEIDQLILRELGAFTDDTETFSRTIRDLQNEITQASMVPLDVVFARLRLPIRDAALKDEKEVRVETVGDDVLIDKTIADALFQPMLHLVRNAVAHGIEGREERLSRGKTSHGTITLFARQEAGQIVIQVEDDGGGLNLAALHARGVQMGLVPANTPLASPLVRDLVFAPGLSTKTEARMTSGRGVGCDVVRRLIERLNGTIRVESEAGKATRFIVWLPLTLAITKALLVRHLDQTYALPLGFLERIIPADDSSVLGNEEESWLKHEETVIGIKKLERVLSLPGTTSPRGPVLILRASQRRLALQVDEVLAQEEIFVRSLGEILTGHPHFSAVTVHGSGELIPILDVPSLLDNRSGATFDAPMTARAESPELVRPRAAASAEASQVRVLVVDDSISVRKVAERTLVGLGAHVTVAVDGMDALEKLRGGQFDIVFTDLEMPRMNGYDLVRELKFLPAFADLPIVIVTSRSAEKHQNYAKELGVSGYITKPFSAESLQDAMRKHTRYGRVEKSEAPGPDSVEAT